MEPISICRLKERILGTIDQTDTIKPQLPAKPTGPAGLGKHMIGCNADVTYNNTRDRGPGWLLESSQYLKIRKIEFN